MIAQSAGDLPDEAAISTATLAELHYGVHLAKDGAKRALRLRRLAEIESRFAALPIDETVARAYGELALATTRAGRKVRTRVVDLFIAATVGRPSRIDFARSDGLPQSRGRSEQRHAARTAGGGGRPSAADVGAGDGCRQ